VIIPTFNRLELLKSTLASVRAQTLNDYEIIVVDDGSTDGTLEYLKLIGDVRIVQQRNQGPASARNCGARKAQGNYLAFLDSDDLWFPWSLQVYWEVIQLHEEPSFLAGKPCRFQCENGLRRVEFASTHVKAFADYFTSGDEWRWWGVSSFVIRRDAFLRVGGFNNARVNGEDVDLALRLGVEPGFVQIIAPWTFAYREHSSSAVSDFSRTLAGAWAQIRAEKLGSYPGGKLRAWERQRILSRHIRPIALRCLRNGLQREGWRLYLHTFSLNAAQGRLAYLVAFPFIALLQLRLLPKSKT
jgi:hypothetical protein